MRHLVVVRHGEIVGGGGWLSEKGRRQMEILAFCLQANDHVGIDRLVLTSPSAEAREGGGIMARELKCRAESSVKLGPDSAEDHYGVLEAVLTHDEVNSLIVVAHRELTERFPAFFVATYLNAPVLVALQRLEMEEGDALAIDIETATYTHLHRFVL